VRFFRRFPLGSRAPREGRIAYSSKALALTDEAVEAFGDLVSAPSWRCDYTSTVIDGLAFSESACGRHSGRGTEFVQDHRRADDREEEQPN
jgi:hypothetical protein